ncbi:MAG TPA: hypothetical protein VG055_13435 [Planctomycetaceae bacterium]|jgi:hypothetical protein|nr:hypothetical protein [Planctomycetaceae bacterium]
MHDNQKNLLRTAERISSHLHGLKAASIPVELPEGDWTQCHSLVRQIDLCTNRSWHHAATVLNDRLERALERCSDRLQEISRQVSAASRLLPPQTPREVFGDLVALSDEFEGAAIDASNQTISVTTEPIVLEEIDLGPFEIRLHWDRVGERRPYEVVAREPNPAGESSETTHPHVRGEQLCEGDGRVSIERALRAGRLLDAFQIVSRILDTYNSGSAYVSLSNWSGSPCADCGAVVGDDDRFTCEYCDDPICRECLSSCGRCDAFCCHSCTNYCRCCEESICSSCRLDCSQCRRLLCRSCISETGLCEECQEEHDAESFDEDEEHSPSVEAEAAVASTARDTEPEQTTAPASI